MVILFYLMLIKLNLIDYYSILFEFLNYYKILLEGAEHY